VQIELFLRVSVESSTFVELCGLVSCECGVRNEAIVSESCQKRHHREMETEMR